MWSVAARSNWPFALLAILSVSYLADLFTSGSTLMMQDTFCDFLPWRLFAREALWSGRLPLWNPFSGYGKSFIADPQTALFYPLHVPFYFLSPAWALKVSWVTHLWIAAASMFCFARYFRLQTVPALIAAVSFAFSTWMIAYMEFLSSFTTAVWGPLVLLRIHILVDHLTSDSRLRSWSTRLWESRRLAALLVLVGAVQYLAGHPEHVLHTWLLAGAFLLVRYVARRDFTTLKGVVESLLIGGPLTIAVVLPQLLLSWELLQHSERADRVDPGLDVASAHPTQWVGLLLPFVFGRPGTDNYWATTIFDFWAGTAYVGLLPLLLAGFAAFYVRNRGPSEEGRSRRELLVAALALLVGGVLMSSGLYTPLYPLLLDHVPGFDRIRWPSKFMLWIVYSLALLAGLGYQAILQRAQERILDRQRAGAKPAGRSGHGRAHGASHRHLPNPHVRHEPHTQKRAVLWTPTCWSCLVVALLALTFLSDFVPRWADSAARLTSEQRLQAQNDVFVALLFGLLSLAAVLARSLRTTAGAGVDAFAIACLFVDLLVVGRQVQPVGSDSIYDLDRELPAKVAANVEAGRIQSGYAPSQRWLYGSRDEELFAWARLAGTSDTWLPFGVYQTWQGGMKSNRYVTFYSLMQTLPPPRAQRLADVGGVRFVADTRFDPIRQPQAPKDVIIAHRDSALPRAYAVAHWTTMREPQRILEQLTEDFFDPRREGIIETSATGGTTDAVPIEPPSSSGITAPPGTVRIASDNLNSVELEAKVDHKSLLILTDAWYPGWTARVNGRRQPVLKVNYLFRGVFLEPGKHRVQFSYEPWQLRYGVWPSLMVILGLWWASRAGREGLVGE
jgi:hypothetical protein